MVISMASSSSTANAVLEAARKSKAPVIIQVSNGGGAFMAGKGLKEKTDTIGSVALAMHVRTVAKFYGIPVILHSDHCAKKVSWGIDVFALLVAIATRLLGN
jgi:fructose-bisphosphate aldolase, class II